MSGLPKKFWRTCALCEVLDAQSGIPPTIPLGLVQGGTLDRFKTMQSVILVGCNQITNAGLTTIGAGCPNSGPFNLSGCYQITDAGLAKIGEGCTKLESLNILSCSEITDAGLASIAEGCPNLRPDKLHPRWRFVHRRFCDPVQYTTQYAVSKQG